MRLTVLLVLLVGAMSMLVSTASAGRGSSSLDLLRSRVPSSSLRSSVMGAVGSEWAAWSPFHLPSAIQPGQLNYFNFSRPEGLREVWLYVPSGYNATVEWPFAFYFHGYGTGPVLQNGYHQGIYLNMTVDAEAAGYLIAFGQGTPSSSGYLSWDGGRCCKGYNSSMVKVDDVQYTRVAVKMIESMVKVDPARRYAMGWSNGGFMAERLACEAHDLFSGICADASSVVIGDTAEGGQRQCDRSFGQAHLDMIHFSGTADTAVAWTGSTWTKNNNDVPSALDDIARWVGRMGCSARLRQSYNDGVFSNLVWEECRGGAEIEFMTVRNGAHQWWTRTNSPGFPFETTTYVLNFFTRTHQRRMDQQQQRDQQ